MARAKKEAALTPEERLQAALVPDWEWPYKLPENWYWTRIGNYVDYVTDYVANGSFASLKANVSIFKDENYALMVKTQDFANGFTKSLTYTDKHGYDFLSKSTLHGGELILSNIGSVGKVFRVPYFDRPMTLASNSVMVKCYNSRDYDWMYYFLLSPIGFEELKSITTGTAVPKFNKTDLKTIPLPVPPLAEQQRIVDRIESLFAKLDEAKEKAQAVVDSFETRKAAILHKAFTGELTTKWREEHGVGMESWHLRTIGEVCENVKVGIVIKPSQYYVPQNEGTPAFRSANVRECRIDDFDWVYLNEKGMKDNSRSIVHTGDVLVVRSGNPGTACVVPERFDGYNAIDILIAVPNKKIIISDYLCYYTNSPLGKKTVEIGKRGIALTHFNVKGFSQMPINIPTIPEQVVIVRTLGDLFAQEQQAKEAAEAVLDQIELMKKSILARAFRGELGTNDPSEESAVELLRQVIEQEDGDVIRPKAKAKRIAIPAEIKSLLSGANEEAIVKLLLKAAPQSVSTQTVMSISKKKFELMDALRNLEKKQIVSKSDSGEYSLVR